MRKTRKTRFAAAMVIASSCLLLFGSMPTRSQSSNRPEPRWASAAPGRIEPKGREVRIAAPAPAIIKEVLVDLNDRVQKGDLLVRLDDEEAQARLLAAEAQVAMRVAERETAKVSEGARDRRKAENSFYDADRRAFEARMALDRLMSEVRAGQASAEDVQKARATLASTADAMRQERDKLNKQLARDLPAPKREDAAVAAARAEVYAASAALERLRLRAPADAAIFEINAKAGEMAGVGGDNPLLRLGDPDRLQVRAEVEERDVGKIYQGQAAVIKSDAFPDRTFEAHVAIISRALTAPHLSWGKRRMQSDIDVLETVLELEPNVPLLPGMHVDVLFRDAGEGQKNAPPTKS